MNATTKDIKIGTTTYQLGRLSARQGSWVVAQFLDCAVSSLFQPDKEIDELQLGGLLASRFGSLSEDIFNNVQAKCLAVVSRYGKVGDADVPMPVLRKDGTWNDVAEPGLPELLALTTACLSFNLHPFFEPGARDTLLTAFPNMSQMNGSDPEAG